MKASARMMRKAFTILILIIWTSLLITKEYADTIENFKVIKVRDGDTFVITIEDTPDV